MVLLGKIFIDDYPSQSLGYDFFYYGLPKTKKFEAADLHGGLSTGVNFNINEYMTLFIEGGFKAGIHIIKASTSRGDVELMFKHYYLEGYASTGIMYRINEPSATNSESKNFNSPVR